MPLERPKTQTVFAWLITALYVAWIAWLGWRHEPWRDEADAWLIARDVSLWRLPHLLRGAGTPALWYLLLMPLAKGGLAYRWMFVLHGLLAASAAAIFAFKAPFSRRVKILVLFGYFVGFEYSVVARTYVLTMLLLFLLADVWRARPRRCVYIGVLLALLCNANVHGLCMASAIGLALLAQVLADRKVHRGALPGMAIALAGAALALATVWPLHGADPPSPPERRYPVIGYVLQQNLVPHLDEGIQYLSVSAPIGRAAQRSAEVGGIVVVLAALYLMRKDFAALSIVLLSTAAMMYVCVCHWFGGERHSGMFFLIVLFGLWISRPNSAEPTENHHESAEPAGQRWAQRLFTLGLAPSLLVGLIWGFAQTRFMYSGAQEAAAFVRDHNLTRFPIVNGRDLQGIALLPWLPGTQLWFPGRREYGADVPWDRHWRLDMAMTDDEVVARARQQFANTTHLLLIAASPLPEKLQGDYRLIFRNTQPVFGHPDETFFIYASDAIAAARFSASQSARIAL